MKITAIKQQVRRAGRYSVYVDNKFVFSLSDTALLQSKIVPGQEVGESEIEDFKRLSADDKSFGLAVNYAMLRPRSTWEMELYLQRKKINPLLSQNILSKLSELQMLDDVAFARSWVSSRRLLRLTSRRRLQQELRAKRVPDDITEQVLAEDDTDESKILRELVTRKRKQSRYHDDQKLMQYLAGQGYEYEDIKSVLREDDN